MHRNELQSSRILAISTNPKTSEVVEENKPHPHIFIKFIIFHFNFMKAINIFVKNSFLLSPKYMLKLIWIKDCLS